MRLLADAARAVLALGLTAALAGCGLAGGERPENLAIAPVTATGPAADYPMVLGEPFTVDGELYTPSDALNYDVVGYAALEPQAAGVTVAHKTLPLPSYVEITALDSGRTILARVERRGPMTGARLIALSRGAQAQLGVADGAPLRVRRVNPPESERAELRAGRPAPERMETPKSLVEVLRRKLPATGAANLRSAVAAVQSQAAPASSPRPIRAAERIAAGSAAAAVPAPAASAAGAGQALPAERRAVTAYPLAPLAQAGSAQMARSGPANALHRPQPLAPGAGFVVQAAAFASKANAEAAAGRLGGFVAPSGRFYRVRTGPYATRGQAEAALAKVRAAGYSDARVVTAG